MIISSEALRELSKHDNYFVRCYVAKNPNTPLDILMKLTNDNSIWVRFYVKNNPSSTEEIIMKVKATDFILDLNENKL